MENNIKKSKEGLKLVVFLLVCLFLVNSLFLANLDNFSFLSKKETFINLYTFIEGNERSI